MSDLSLAAKILRGLESGANFLAPLATGLLTATGVVPPNNATMDLIIGSVKAGIGLAAELAERNMSPIEHITRMKASLGDFAQAVSDAEEYARNPPSKL